MKCLFGSVVEIVFYLEIYQNKIFIFFKFIFTSTHQNDPKTYIKFFKNTVRPNAKQSKKQGVMISINTALAPN